MKPLDFKGSLGRLLGDWLRPEAAWPTVVVVLGVVSVAFR